MVSDNEALRMADEARREVDREIAAEYDRRRLGERDRDEDDFEPPDRPVPPPPPEGPRGRHVSREDRLAALESGYGRELPPPLRDAVLGVPVPEEEPIEIPIDPETGKAKLGGIADVT